MAEINWELVTNHFSEPETCSELITLLTPTEPTGSAQSIITLSWKKKAFYKREDILVFLNYATKKLAELSSIDKDYFPAVLRMMRLYREIGEEESAFLLAEKEQIIPYLKTSLNFSQWDVPTTTTALGYLVSKYKVRPLDSADIQMFHRVKMCTEWTRTLGHMLTHQELFSFYLWYVRMFGKDMTSAELDDYLMGVATYLVNHFPDLYSEQVAIDYSRWVHKFSQLPIHKTIIHTHRALCSHLIELIDIFPPEKMDDYNIELKILLQNLTPNFLDRYGELVGKLVSYVGFYEKFSNRLQLNYFEDMILSAIDTNNGQVELIKSFLIPQLINDFGDLIVTLFEHKKGRLIESLLCDWLTAEDHETLNEVYEMEVLYAAFGKG